MKAGIYYRVSTERQDFDSQRSEIERWLASRPEPPTVVVYTDPARSGKDGKRPGYQALLAAAGRGEIDTIVVYRLDRFSRDATSAIRTILDLDALGVAFVSVSQPALNLGHDVPFRRTMLSAFAEIAEIERETIVDRVRAGLDAARKRGVRLGPPIKVTPAVIALAVEMRQNGHSIRNISRECDLGRSTVYKLLGAANAKRESIPRRRGLRHE